MQPRAYREGKAVGDLKESVFKAYIVQIRRLRGNLGLLLLQSTPVERVDVKYEFVESMTYVSYEHI
ncbi:hypothetical protein [Pseudomonas sp. 25 E 4]|nr:hypothetical protein [Pseudomonas sp. 25 E 4]